MTSEEPAIAPELAARVQRTVGDALAAEAAEAPARARRSLSASVLALLLAIAVVVYFGVSPFSARPASAWGGVALAALWVASVALLPARPGIARGRWSRRLLGCAAAIYLVVLAASPMGTVHPVAAFTLDALICLGMALGLSAASLGLLLWARGREQHWLLGAAAGLAAGLLGVASIQIHCGNDDLLHQLIGHALALALAALAGAALVRRVRLR